MIEPRVARLFVDSLIEGFHQRANDPIGPTAIFETRGKTMMEANFEPGAPTAATSQAISLKRLADHLIDLTLILSASPSLVDFHLPGAETVVVKKSSSEMSTLAAKYIALDMEGLSTELGLLSVGGKMPEAFAADIRSLAASVLSQDEVKGQ